MKVLLLSGNKHIESQGEKHPPNTVILSANQVEILTFSHLVICVSSRLHILHPCVGRDGGMYLVTQIHTSIFARALGSVI